MDKRGTLKLRNNKQLFCNACGKVIKVEQGILKEDIFEASKEWGYFSKNDLEIHKFNICEDCYEKMILTFKVPVEVVNKKEILQ